MEAPAALAAAATEAAAAASLASAAVAATAAAAAYPQYWEGEGVKMSRAVARTGLVKRRIITWGSTLETSFGTAGVPR